MNNQTMAVLKRGLEDARVYRARSAQQVADHEAELARHRADLAQHDTYIAALEEDIAKAESGV